MKLYTDRFAPSPRRVRMYAAEKGIELEYVNVEIGAGQNLAPEYLAINPLGELPALVLDDGTCLTESLAICRWLEARHPEPPLFGRTADERARIDACIYRLMFRLYVPTTHVFRHTHRWWAGRIEQVPAWGEQQRAAVLAEYAALDAVLATQEFVAGDRFTMADIVAFTAIDFGKPSGLRLGELQPHAQRWYAAVRARPSAAA